jgi:hypothetical protein
MLERIQDCAATALPSLQSVGRAAAVAVVVAQLESTGDGDDVCVCV